MTTTTPTPRPVPIAVWPVAQASAPQRRGHYPAAPASHRTTILLTLARRIVETYSSPGQLVIDPLGGTSAIVIAAAEAGRRAIGIEAESRSATSARANLRHVLEPDRQASAEVRVGDACRLTDVVRDVAGTVDLVATAPPYGLAIDTRATQGSPTGRARCDRATRNRPPSRVQSDHRRGHADLAKMATLYASCCAILRPGGLLVTVTRNQRRGGRCIDLAAATVGLATGAGFSYHQHVIALLCAVEGNGLAARPVFWQHKQTRHRHGSPTHLPAHADVLVFTKAGGSRG